MGGDQTGAKSAGENSTRTWLDRPKTRLKEDSAKGKLD